MKIGPRKALPVNRGKPRIFHFGHRGGVEWLIMVPKANNNESSVVPPNPRLDAFSIFLSGRQGSCVFTVVGEPLRVPSRVSR